MKIKKHILLILLLAILILSVASCSDSGETLSTEIISARIKNDRDSAVVEATLDSEFLEAYGNGDVFLLSIASCDTENLSSAEVVGQARAKANLKFKFSLSDHKLGATSSFVLAKKISGEETDRAVYAAISEIEYFNNPELLAATAKVPETSASLKGVDTDSLTDAIGLGADRIIFELNIEKLILDGYREGAINYSFGGRSYYFDGAAVTELDRRISEANRLGVRVYLRSLLGAPIESTPEYLYCSGAGKGAEYYCVNMADKQAARAVCALYSFIGSRYSGGDILAIDHIIGKTVNLNNKTCYAGAIENDGFYSLYSAWARAAYNATTSCNSSAKIYIPVDNSLHVEGSGISAKMLLSGICAQAQRSGSFGFGIALDLGEGGDLGNLLSGNGTDFVSVGVGNLDSFTSLLDSEEMRFHGQRRDIIIDSLSLDAGMGEANRAAYYVCAYYKAAEAGFSALFYNGDKLLSEDGKEDALASAIRLCGDKNTTSLLKIADKMPCGKELDLKGNVSQRLTYEEEASLEIGKRSRSNKKEIELDLASFICGGGVYNADISSETTIFGSRAEALTVSVRLSADGGYITSSSLPCKDIVESGYLALNMKASDTARVTVILSSDSEKNPLYIGNATVYAAEKIFFFDIKDFTDSLSSSDKLTLTIVMPEGEEGEFELSLTDVALYGSSGNGLAITLTALGVFVAALAICGILFLLTRRRKRRTEDERK